MATIYPYMQILHLFFAIIFLGYIFFDVVIFNSLKSKLGENYKQAKQAIGSKAIKIMPFCLLGLFITGGAMMSTWVGSKAGGYFQTPLQQILMIKVILAFIIGFGVIINLSMKAMGMEPFKFMKENLHKIAFVLGFFIVLFAKVMFLV